MEAKHETDLLLVEDNPRDAELTLRVLRKHRLANNIVHVKDGAEALEWLFGPASRPDGIRNYPRVVILDLKLPKVSGIDVLRAIRADERTHTLPVVVLTSSREEGDVVESYRLGLNSYVVKPVDFEQFSAAVAEAGRYWLIVNQPVTQ